MANKNCKNDGPMFVIPAEIMSSLRRCNTRDPTPEDSEPQGAEMVQVSRKDMRYRVDDTMKYPHSAIAYMQMTFHNDDDDDEFGEDYAGTGFLCDGFTFVTAGHNIIKVNDDKSRVPATTVTLMFGLDGAQDFVQKKSFALKGSDFTVPKEHRKASDQYDIAVVNLQDFYHRKQSEGITLDWSLSDLPKETFYSYAIPEHHGALDGKYSICGNFNIFPKYNYSL